MNAHARTAAFFDLDKTIIATSSSAAFFKPFLSNKLMSRTDAIRTGYAQLLFVMGGADERQTNRLRDALSDLIRGWDVKKVRSIVEQTVHEFIDPVVYQEAVRLIRRHQENGRDVIIVSASGSEVVEPIAAMLGVTQVIASRMEVKDGRYTGEISFYAYGAHKAQAMLELADRAGYDLANSYAYSDSMTDAPMLNAVGYGFAVNPDRGMRRAAQDNGWGVLRFRKPIALREAAATGSAITLSVVLVAVVVGVVVWRKSRKRSHGGIPGEGSA